ncbi:hypothetical protein LG314_11325 [Agrococcus terreus]|uniref:hypothetical protein n=1 Tax=Agrococcus terreus TaxID=574649 RepID=UPI00384AC5A0
MDLPLVTADTGSLLRLDRDPRMLRVRRGTYVDAAAHDAADRRLRYLTAIAAVAAARPGAIFARESALALAGLPFGAPVDVFTIGDPTSSGRKAGVRNSHVAIGDGDVIVDGLARCSIPFALADLARRGRQLDAVSAMDAALATSAVERDAVLEALRRQGPKGQRRAEWVVAFADAEAESVGESWSRVLLHRLGAPVPELQARIPTVLGDKRADFRWRRPGRRPLAGEFDGFVKYGRIAQESGEVPAEAVFREKRREDAIRATHDVARWVFADLLDPRRLARILRAGGLDVRTTPFPGW